MKGLLIFLIIVVSGLGFIYYQETYTCRNPLAYDVGGFDTRFGITKEKYLATIKEAELVWERGTGQELFNYQSGAKFKINLVFDERQEQTIEANQSKEAIEGSRSTYDALLSQYKVLESSYRSDLSAYNSVVNEFEQRLRAYNERVAAVNAKGGAAPTDYQELQKEKKYLEDFQNQLNRDREDLNAKASQLNLLSEQVNQLAKKLNINVDMHNERFGEAREFDQGDYLNNRINVYQFETISDLRLVLVHELGHALDIKHVENPKSVMFYLMEKQDINNPTLSVEDIAAFNHRCDFSLPNLRNLFNSSILSKFAY